jgi:hypothetical protein
MSVAEAVHGDRLDDKEPKELILSDGSKLALGPGAGDRVLWRHDNGRGDEAISVSDALDLAGSEFAGYVTIRTRTEAQWLRTIAEWCALEADRLDGELERVV